MHEKSLVKLIAKSAPWLSPIPSAYFVARASVKHLEVIRPVDIVIALIVETLGITSIHTVLWLYGWNQESVTASGNVRKKDGKLRVLVPHLEILLSVIISALYLLVTISLTVILEVAPSLSIYAPALFPFLSIVGAVNLVLIARQEIRENTPKEYREPKQKPNEKPKSQNIPILGDSLNGRNAKKEARKAVLLTLYQNNPTLSTINAAQNIGVTDQTIRNYLGELEQDNHIERSEGAVKVK